ncbi:MAG: flagellar protein FlgN [Spirochaetota bacterium]|jgi:flagellar biosynthesis/type III secretory pathway chaperone|nr:flagellar protein FlgN [Spirochaetota bacterium]
MYDKDTFDRITEILQDEKRSLEQLAAFEEYRLRLLEESNWPKLEAIEAEICTVMDQVYALEKERLFAGSRMLHTNNPDTLSALIAVVQPEDRESLVQLRNDMTAVIQRLQFLKSVSEAIMRDKKALADMALAAAKGESGQGEYTEDGTMREVNTGTASILFSRKI